ncbi:MAG: DUF2079 domain-containing protein [Deltaproteobacteria bacterium]|nr:DUF2079 domain-containing protein [Deltaproteobacteria bacterium]
MSKRAKLAVLISAGLFGSVFLWQAFARYATFHNQTFDLAFYARMAWGSVRGSFWDPIINAHFLGLHMSWLMLPLGLLGLAFGSVSVLLISQVVAVCAVCWPLARIGARRFGDTGAIISAVIWLLYPNLGHTLSNEFHPGTVATLPLACALDALDREHRNPLILWTIALVACRADLSFMAFMIGLLAVVKGGRVRRTGFWLAGFSLLYLALFLLVIQPAFAPAQGSLQAHFSKWGNSVSEVFLNLLSSPRELFDHFSEPRRLLYLPKLLAPLLLLPLLSPRWLLVAIPPAAINLFSDFPTTTDMDCHYQTLIVAPLVVAAAVGLGNIHSVRVSRLAWFFLLIGGLFSNLLAAGMPWSLDYQAGDYREDALTRSSRRVLAAIPDRASVQAPDRLLPHLAERMNLHRAPPPERNADFVVLDISHRQRYARQETLLRTTEEPEVSNWFARSDHALVHAEDDLVVLQRNRSPRQGLAKRYFVGNASPDEGTRLTVSVQRSNESAANSPVKPSAPEAPARMVRAVPDEPDRGRKPVLRDESAAVVVKQQHPPEQLRLTECLAVLRGSLQGERLCLEFVARGSCARDLAIRLGPVPKSRRVDLLFDGLLSPIHLRASDRLVSCHRLSDKEREAILLEGVYVGALRRSGARPEPTDPISVRVAIAEPR